MTQTPDRPTGAVTPEEVRRPLAAYRVLAWATGLWLIALCYAIYVRYVLKVPDWPWVRARLGCFRRSARHTSSRETLWTTRTKLYGARPSAPYWPAPSRCWASSSSTTEPPR